MIEARKTMVDPTLINLNGNKEFKNHECNNYNPTPKKTISIINANKVKAMKQ